MFPSRIQLGLLLLCTPLLAFGEPLLIRNSPRPFSVVAPTSWSQQPPGTGNSRVRFVSPSGTPHAECAVLVVDYPSLRNQPQSFFDSQMLEAQDARELSQHLSATQNNVTVLGTWTGHISGYPAQLSNVL